MSKITDKRRLIQKRVLSEECTDPCEGKPLNWRNVRFTGDEKWRKSTQGLKTCPSLLQESDPISCRGTRTGIKQSEKIGKRLALCNGGVQWRRA